MLWLASQATEWQASAFSAMAVPWPRPWDSGRMLLPPEAGLAPGPPCCLSLAYCVACLAGVSPAAPAAGPGWMWFPVVARCLLRVRGVRCSLQ